VDALEGVAELNPMIVRQASLVAIAALNEWVQKQADSGFVQSRPASVSSGAMTCVTP